MSCQCDKDCLVSEDYTYLISCIEANKEAIADIVLLLKEKGLLK